MIVQVAPRITTQTPPDERERIMLDLEHEVGPRIEFYEALVGLVRGRPSLREIARRIEAVERRTERRGAE